MDKAYVTRFREESERFVAETEAYVKTMSMRGKRLYVSCTSGLQTVYLHEMSETVLPTVFEIHGGCFSQGTSANDDAMRQELCEHTGFRVIGLGYRKSTNAPFPSALEDVFDQICYFVEHAEEYHIDVTRMAVWGHSAGGNLACQAAWMGRLSGKYAMQLLMLDYPYLDVCLDGTLRSAESCGLTTAQLDAMREVYAPNVNRSSCWVSPAFASDSELKELPPVSMVLCGHDPLAAEDATFLNRLLQLGGCVTAQKFEQMEHGFLELWYFREWYLKDAAICAQMEQDARRALEFQARAAMQFLKD